MERSRSRRRPVLGCSDERAARAHAADRRQAAGSSHVVSIFAAVWIAVTISCSLPVLVKRRAASAGAIRMSPAVAMSRVSSISKPACPAARALSGDRRGASFHAGGGARASHASSPSSSIRALEQELGCDPFVRSTRQVELTEAGRALVPAARRTVSAAEDGWGRGCRGPRAGARTPGDRCRSGARPGQPAGAPCALSPQAPGGDAADPSCWRTRARATDGRWRDRSVDR